MRTPRDWAMDLAVMTALGAFLGVIGPFGSFYGGPLGTRLIYWIGSMWIGFAVISTVVRLAMQLAMRWDVPFWIALAGSVAVGSLPLTLLVHVAQTLVFPGGPHHEDLLQSYGYVLALSEPFAFVYSFVINRGWHDGASQAPSPQPISKAPTADGEHKRFIDRLPTRLGRGLLCLQMEDHYVRAHTALGSDLVLMSLKDAMAELYGADGLQVHRSWWVARHAVSEVLVSGRNVVLRLTNGVEAPVSRASIATLRAAGWLEPADADTGAAATDA